MVFSLYTKQRILVYFYQGYKPHTIQRLLLQEGLKTSKWGIALFIKRFQVDGVLTRRVGSGRPSKVTAEVKAIVEEQMRQDDETTAYQLHKLLVDKGYNISRRTILRCRTSLGWTFRGSSYCQLIRHVNKEKRLEWAKEHLDEDFDSVVWTDECTVQLETHRQFACRKREEPPKNKPRFVVRNTIHVVHNTIHVVLLCQMV